MAESTTPTKRANVVLREFNISFETLVETLKKKGVTPPETANAKISEEAYFILQREFSQDKKIKEEADKKLKQLQSDKKETVTLDKVIKKQEEEKISEEKIIIKNAATAEIISPEIIKSEKEKKIISKQTDTISESKEPKKREETLQSDDIVKTEIPKIDGPKVKGKIELEKTTKKTSKDKETKEEKKSTTTTKKAKTKKEETTDEPKGTTKKGTKSTSKKSVLSSEAISEDRKESSSSIDAPQLKVSETEAKTTIENTSDFAISTINQTDQKEEEKFIKTEIPTQEQPKVLGKIDLSQFEKTKPKEEKPKKEEKKPIFSTSTPVSPSQKEQESHHKKDKKRKRIGKPDTSTSNNETFKKDKHKPFRKPFEERTSFSSPKTEPDPEEVAKRIKETLARKEKEKQERSKLEKIKREAKEKIKEKLEKQKEQVAEESKILKVTEFVTANQLANMMNVPVAKVIQACMQLGLFVSINQRLDAETISIVAEEFGHKVQFVTVEDVENIEEKEETNPENLVPRPPIVTVMGHVDHGKTSLLDYIRKSNVVAGEAGGITQHIGAYHVTLPNGKGITFLDTPGHEAFTAMRARGAKLTDVAIIVIAADDGIMPQTVEAINHAQAAGVPMVFAINKIDKPGANPDKIREALANMNILVEEWGGKYQCQEISAKKGLNVDLLLEKVLLEAEFLELKADPTRKATGTVIEAALEEGRGYVATVLVQNGTLKVGDVLLAGAYSGKVRAMFNERGQKINEAGPSIPAKVLGLDGAPNAGDKFVVMEDEREAREIANKRQQLIREQALRAQKHITLDEIGRRLAIGDFKELKIIVKADVDGSAEALTDALLKLSTDKIQVSVIHKAVGAISESDVLLASASDAIIIGFQVRPTLKARQLAEKEEIEIRTYSIIYDAINDVKAAMEGMLEPKFEEKITCNVEVREIFKISKVGTVAGCYVLDGKLTRQTKVRVIRDGIVVYTGNLSSLKRFKEDVKEVTAGFECGLTIENFNDIKVGDIIEGFEMVEVKPKL
ncbi:MAG: translation initiation factor IF-2 [Bacteroidia bacterium]|nr:MAG: translation initiation factor IF-2 [Bacteroidia bacterium]